jgi:hypothetical protein
VIEQHDLDLFEQASRRCRRFAFLQFPITHPTLMNADSFRQILLAETGKDACCPQLSPSDYIRQGPASIYLPLEGKLVFSGSVWSGYRTKRTGAGLSHSG